MTRGDYFLFDSVFIKTKVIKLNFFLKNQNRFKPTSFGSVRFGLFLGQKPVQIGLVRFFRFGLVLARFFPVWVRFFRF
jgi:hypothetical protein